MKYTFVFKNPILTHFTFTAAIPAFLPNSWNISFSPSPNCIIPMKFCFKTSLSPDSALSLPEKILGVREETDLAGPVISLAARRKCWNYLHAIFLPNIKVSGSSVKGLVTEICARMRTSSKEVQGRLCQRHFAT